MRKLILPILASFALCGTASATVIVLDFDDKDAGQIVDGQINPFVSLSTTGGTGSSIVFDTRNPTGGDEDLALITNVTPGMGNLSPGGNVLIIAENLIDADMNGLVDVPDDNASGGTFTFDFAQDVTFFGFNGIDFTDGRGFLQVDLFDSLGASLLSTRIDDIGGFSVDIIAEVGDNAFFGLFANVFGENGIAGVSQAQITLGGSGAIDSLTFHVNEVPIPAALPLMVTALGFGGFASRRRKARLAQ